MDDRETIIAQLTRRVELLEQQLTESETTCDTFERMLEHIADGVTVQAPDGRLIYANDTAGQLCGYPSGQALVAAPLDEIMQRFEVLDEAGQPFGMERLPGRRALQGERHPPDAIVRVRVRGDQGEEWSLIKARPVLDPGGGVRMVINVWHNISALKQVEAALREQSEYLGVTLASIGDAVIVTDVQGQVTFLNPVAERLTGWQTADAQGQPLDVVFHIVNEETRAIVESPVSKVLREGTIVGLANHTILLARDGREVPIDDSGAPIRSADGELRGVVLVFRDVSERKHEEQLQRFRGEAIAVLTASLDVNTTLTTLAQLAVPRLGDWCGVDLLVAHGVLQRLAVVHRDPAKVAWAHEIHKRYPPNLESDQGMGRVLRTGETLLIPKITDEMLVASARDQAHLALMRAVGMTSGMVVPLKARGQIFGAITLVSAESGHIYGEADQLLAEEIARRASIAIDNARLYSEAQLARQSAEQSSERLRRLQTITAALSEALTRSQVAEVIVGQGRASLGAHAGMVNTIGEEGTALELLATEGYPSELVEQLRHVPLDDESPITYAARTGSPVWLGFPEEYIERFPLAAHASLPVSSTKSQASLPMIVDGRPIGALSFSFPYTRSFEEDERDFMFALARQCAQALERARLYDEAQQAIRLRDQFLALAAHELKTPMTTILASGQLLQRHIEQDETASARDRQRARSMVDQTQRLNRLITSLLDLSRIQEGRLAIEQALIDLAEVVKQLVEEARPTLTRHPVLLQLPEEPCWVAGDRLRLEQVLQNLLQNAVKYSPEGGQIAVAIVARPDQICMSVSDQGIGIPAEELPRIFERFYRGKEVNTTQLSGMGIGLYVVKEIVSLHGGVVTVESQPGQGTSFEVRLPRITP